MNIVGLICEYNPLHNGHVYHFNEVKEKSKADAIIVSMSSYLTQRGDLAILDKFTRAKLALEMGIDLIIECPSILSMNEAAIFAAAHINNLNMLCVSEIWIGSEKNDPSIYPIYDKFVNSNSFKVSVKDNISKGLSPKMAYRQAFIDNKVEPLMSNDLLGLFYYQAIQKINPSIKLKTIKRTNSFASKEFNSSTIQSASAIRHNLSQAIDFVPPYVLPHLKNAFDINKVIPFIDYNLIIKNNIDQLIESNEGIENRLSFNSLDNFDDVVYKISTKRYSEGKIKRLLMDVLFNLTKKDLSSCLNEHNFVRVLGFNDKGQQLLNARKKDCKIYTNIKDGINHSLDIELRISRILDLIYKTNLFVQEQKGPIII